MAQIGTKGDAGTAFGCMVALGIAVVVALHYFNPQFAPFLDRQTSAPPAPIGRYQIISGKTHAVVFDLHEEDAMIKVDTTTGQTWVFHPLESGKVFPESKLDIEPYRWQEIKD